MANHVQTVVHAPGSGRAIGRRAALKVGIGTAAAGLLARRAGAADPPPVTALPPAVDPAPSVDARLPCQIAPDVWLIPDRRVALVPNIGIVVGRTAALVIDCGLGPDSGRAVLDVARRLAPGRKLILTQTHAHPEHAFGAMAFRGHADVYLNRAQNDYLTSTGPALLEMFRAVLCPAASRLLDGVEIVPATQTYDGDHGSVDLGGRTVEFRSWGTAHSPGDQTVYLPAERILFAGDLIEERMFPIIPFFPPTIPRSAIDVRRWAQALAEIERIDPAIVVPGHGNLGRAEIAREVREYLDAVGRQASAVAAGPGLDRRLVELAAEVRADHPTWDHTQFIAPAVQYFAPA